MAEPWWMNSRRDVTGRDLDWGNHPVECTTFSGRDCVYLLLPGTLSLCAEDTIVFGIIIRRRRTIMCVISSMSNPRFSWWNQLKSTILAPQIHHVLDRLWRRPGTYDLVRKNCWGSRTKRATCWGDPPFLLHWDGHWLVSYLVNGLIPSLQKIKDPLNGSNGMWKFPTKPWFLRWCWILGGKGLYLVLFAVCITRSACSYHAGIARFSHGPSKLRWGAVALGDFRGYHMI